MTDSFNKVNVKESTIVLIITEERSFRNILRKSSKRPLQVKLF